MRYAMGNDSFVPVASPFQNWIVAKLPDAAEHWHDRLNRILGDKWQLWGKVAENDDLIHIVVRKRED